MGDITHDDIAQALQNALAAAQETGDGTIDYSHGFSMSEITKLLGVKRREAYKRVGIAIENGTIECTGRQLRGNIANAWNSVPVYRAKE